MWLARQSTLAPTSMRKTLPVVGQQHADGGALDAGDASQDEEGGGHDGAGVAGGDDGVCFAVAHQGHGDVDCGVGVAAHFTGDVVFAHTDSVAGVDDLYAGFGGMLDQLGLEPGLRADNGDVDVVFLGGEEGALRARRGEVAAHRVECDSHREPSALATKTRLSPCPTGQRS